MSNIREVAKAAGVSTATVSRVINHDTEGRMTEETKERDWAAIAEVKNWGLTEDLKEASRLAMEAGVDIDMCTDCYQNNLEELVKEGKLKAELLDEAVMRVLKLKNDLGLFEDPYHGAGADKFEKVALCH